MLNEETKSKSETEVVPAEALANEPAEKPAEKSVKSKGPVFTRNSEGGPLVTE